MLKIELIYDPAIPLLSTYTKESVPGYNGATCTTMFIIALFTIAKLWKQPESPINDEWIKKCGIYIYIYIYIYYGVLFGHKDK
jgi:hypothetical protein